MGESISVILPIHRWHDRVIEAIGSSLTQTHDDFELLIVVNGHDQTLASKISMIQAMDNRISVLLHDRENLASALNHGIGQARNEYIARMDSDDLSHADRLKMQLKYMQEHPGIAGCGAGACFVDGDDRVRDIVTPPTSSMQARWKLMVWNPFVHGSMMLRKTHVIQAGGYDEKLERAQDYDLWIRLSKVGLGGIPDILYTHRLGSNSQAGLGRIQSQVTADRLLVLWGGLPEGDPAQVNGAMSKIAMGDQSGRLEIEQLMETNGPTRASLTAWMWSCSVHPIAPTNTKGRFDRLHAGAEMLKSMGINRVWVWGAGDFGRFILAHRDVLDVQVAGVLDDHRHGQMLGEFVVCDPRSVEAIGGEGQAVVIASDLYEEQIWKQSAMLRQRGVCVVRLPVCASGDVVRVSMDSGVV